MWICEKCGNEFFTPALDYSCPDCASKFIFEDNDDTENIDDE